MKKITIFLSIFVLLPLTACSNITDPIISEDTKLQTCPDEMIDNQMPRVVFDDASLANANNTKYYILDGERRELSEFDEDWVKENCKVKIQTVY